MDETLEPPEILNNQECPVCKAKTLTLMEDHREIPYFGKCYLFSMSCSSCKYHKADVETEEKHEPARYTLDITGENDMKIRIVKSAEGTIKIPHMISIEGGEQGTGYITNVEGVLERVKKAIEFARDNEENEEVLKKAKNQLKKLTRIMWGQEPAKLIIEDPSGNSAIISEKAVKAKL